jgi:hypothetical protein
MKMKLRQIRHRAQVCDIDILIQVRNEIVNHSTDALGALSGCRAFHVRPLTGSILLVSQGDFLTRIAHLIHRLFTESRQRGKSGLTLQN